MHPSIQEGHVKLAYPQKWILMESFVDKDVTKKRQVIAFFTFMYKLHAQNY